MKRFDVANKNFGVTLKIVAGATDHWSCAEFEGCHDRVVDRHTLQWWSLLATTP